MTIVVVFVFACFTVHQGRQKTISTVVAKFTLPIRDRYRFQNTVIVSGESSVIITVSIESEYK